MQKVPKKPVFKKIDLSSLAAVDWKDKNAALSAIGALKKDVEANSSAQEDYMNEALLASKERIREMQSSLSFGKKAHNDTSQVNSDALLKQARTDVKQMMADSNAIITDYFNAMTKFREPSNFDFAGPDFSKLLKQLRINIQDADKKVSAVPGQIKALEGFASGLIKEIREVRGNIADDLVRLKKLESAGKKADALSKDVSTHLAKMGSSVGQMDGMIARLPGTHKDLKGLATDFEARYKKFYDGMGGIVTLRHAMETLSKGFSGHGFSDKVKPVVKDAETMWSKLIKERDSVGKNLKALLKNKALPQDVKSKLPKDLKG